MGIEVMSSADRTVEAGVAPDGNAASDTADALAGLLGEIKSQLADAERLHADAMRDAQARLNEIAGRSERARATLPSAVAPALERVSVGAFELAQRIAVAQSDRQASAPATIGAALDPWDTDSAEALMSLYETSAALPGDAAHADLVFADPADIAATSLARRAAAAAEHRSWLDQRFNDIAIRVEKSIATVHPEGSLAVLDQRLDQLEARFGAALECVASRSDVDGLRLVETQVGEIASHLEATQRQLARLDDIERQLQALTAASEMSRAESQNGPPQPTQTAGEINSFIQETAERLAERLSPMSHPQTLAHVDRVESLLEAFIVERRREDSNTAGALDTMQDAMIRLIDRVEAIDSRPSESAAAPQPNTPFNHTELAEQYVRHLAEQAEGPREPATSAVAQAAVDHSPAAGAAAFASAAKRAAPTHPSDAAADRVIMPDRLRKEIEAVALRAKARVSEPAADDEFDVVTPPRSRAKPRPVMPAASRPFNQRILAVCCVGLAMYGAGYFGWRIHTDGVLNGLAEKFDGKVPGTALRGDATLTRGTSKSASTGDNPNSPTGNAIIEAGQAVGATPFDETSLDAAARTEADRRMLTQPAVTVMRGAVSLGMAVQQATPASLASEQAQRPPADASAPEPSLGAIEMPPAAIGPSSLRAAASKGDPSAEFEVAIRFAEGKGVKQDFKLAMTWYQRAAARGFVPAQYRLATLYERGLGTKADLPRARLWYSRAAEQGNVKAMHNLAVLNAGRESGTPDYATAAQWFTEAAERGLADSQFNLGVLFENGLGTVKDGQQAYKWFALAARAGDKEAGKRRDVLATKLDTDAFAAAEKLVANWRARSFDMAANDPRAAADAWRNRVAQSDGQPSAPAPRQTPKGSPATTE